MSAASQPERGVALAMEVLRLSEAASHIAILSLLGDKIDEASTFAQMRKAYLKLSLMIHPDKLGKKFGEAKAAFQALVEAFERLTQPEVVQEGKKKKGQKTFGRSNEGCVRTTVKCPRCQEAWGTAIDGNPKYCYNFMMTGLKQYTCSTCLLCFGCMSAIHECTFCNASFEYRIEDFHKKITCPSCEKSFGFYMFPCSDSALKDAKAEVTKLVQQQRKTDATARRRAESSRRRGGGSLDNETAAFAFATGLVDECPQCGEHFTNEDESIEHLRTCNDKVKHEAHKEKKTAAATKAALKRKRAKDDASTLSDAAWTFTGGTTSKLWMLSDTELKKHADAAGIDMPTNANRKQLLQALAAHRSKTMMLGDDGVPDDFESMTMDQLRELLICHNIDAKKSKLSTKKKMIDALEKLKFANVLEQKAPVFLALYDAPLEKVFLLKETGESSKAKKGENSTAKKGGSSTAKKGESSKAPAAKKSRNM